MTDLQPKLDALRAALIGRKIMEARSDTNELVLDDGSIITFDEYGDCCAWASVERMSAYDNVITDVRVAADLNDPDYDGDGNVSIFALSSVSPETEIAHIVGNEGSGYYSYGVTIMLNGVEIDEVAQP